MIPVYFRSLEQVDYHPMAQTAYLKGLLQPFKGKGSLEVWAIDCARLRDELIALAAKKILAQATAYPFNRLPIQLSQQVTSAGTTFLRWRNLNRSAMGVALWEQLISSEATPAVLIDDLYAMEMQRIALNMQISLSHTLSRQAFDCAQKMAHAEEAYLQRINRSTDPQESP
ncbi:integrase [Pseudomonas fluorescens]|nr:integrase [Pseudomonas fluorescens]